MTLAGGRDRALHMTALLLDTHAFVWAQSAPDRLSPTARKALEDGHNRLVVSAATAWELVIKFRAGRFPTAEPLVRQFESLSESLGIEVLPISAAHALRAGGLRWDHTDPFDRMLVAQAMLEDCVLVTRDRAMADVVGLSILW